MPSNQEPIMPNNNELEQLKQAIVAWQDKYLVRVNKKGHAQNALADLVSLITQSRISLLEGLKEQKIGYGVHQGIAWAVPVTHIDAALATEKAKLNGDQMDA